MARRTNMTADVMNAHKHLKKTGEALGSSLEKPSSGFNTRTAEVYLAEVHSLIHNMLNLAVHAAETGSNESTSPTAYQKQITKRLAVMANNAARTAFGNKKLPDCKSNAVVIPIRTNKAGRTTITIQ